MNHVAKGLTNYDLDDVAQLIFSDNVERGWWQISSEGVVIPRNVGELLCLVHSEIDEADTDEADDKLPHRSGFEVELADTAIRLFDMLGYYKSENPLMDIRRIWNTVEVPLSIPGKMTTREHWLLHMHKLTTGAMENFRKGRPQEGCTHLVALLMCLDHAASIFALDLKGAIDEKLAYNAVRADHKLENRRAEGGKQF